MVAIPVDIIHDSLRSYLEIRDPKGGGGGGGGGGGKGGGFKGGGSSGGAAAGNGEPLETWKIIVIIVSITWTVCLICLWAYFANRDAKENPGKPHRAWRSFVKALLWSLLLYPIVWGVKKAIGRSKRRGGEYSKVEDDRSNLMQHHNEPTSYAGAGDGNLKTAAFQPPPTPSPMASRDPSPTPQPPPYRADDTGAAHAYYAPPPMPPPAVSHQYYDPISR